MYPVTVVRATLREIKNIITADTPTHGALRDRVAGIVLISVVIDVICAGLALALERHVPQTDLQSYGSALFWCTTQLLTVSSSIHNPVSFGGRVLDVLMEGYAIIVVSTLAGSMGAFLIKRAQEEERREPQAAAKTTTAPA